jgi:hypothetical protein
MTGIVKEVVILAVTKMHGGVCTAGIDAEGRWIRPIRPMTKRVGEPDTITDYCLLPLDFFHGGRSHLICGALTRLYLKAHTPMRPHVEDWTIALQQKPQLLRELSGQEQADFLAQHCESDLSALVPNEERSLGLFLPDTFRFHFGTNKAGTDITVRADFVLRSQTFSEIGCTDLRMRALGRKLLERSGGMTQRLTRADFERRGKQLTYLTLGLSRLYQGKHWLIIVGVHSIPELAMEIDYGRL